MGQRQAFTLIEVLISIALMGIIMVALFSTVDMMQDSNQHLLKYIEKSKIETRSSKTLYQDILGSDGNITLTKDEFSRLCMEHTKNSLYGLPLAKVCWVVLKQSQALVRIEGNAYHLPIKDDEHVEIDSIMEEVTLFDLYHQKDKLLVMLQKGKEEPISFLVQGVTMPKKKEPKKKAKNTTVPNNPTQSRVLGGL